MSGPNPVSLLQHSIAFKSSAELASSYWLARSRDGLSPRLLVGLPQPGLTRSDRYVSKTWTVQITDLTQRMMSDSRDSLLRTRDIQSCNMTLNIDIQPSANTPRVLQNLFDNLFL